MILEPHVAMTPRKKDHSNGELALPVRPAEMAEKLFWAVFEHWGELSPRFVSGTGRKRFAGKFKRLIHLVDSTTIPLIGSCLD